MPSWIRSAVMLIVCTVWAIGMLNTFLHGGTPTAVGWGVPGATWVLLTGAINGLKRVRVEVDEGDDKPKPGDKS
jgi:hypothetical protein